MGKIVDLSGKTFGRWNVLELSHNTNSVLYWKCRCICGTEKVVFGGDLKRGVSKSCGCLAREVAGQHVITHGMTSHPAHRNWISMNQRCYNQESNDYQWYGARGIKVCERWQDSFEDFWKDTGPTWQSGLTLDRKKVDQDYGPDNCRWATRKEQARNRRNNRIVDTPNGPMLLIEAAETYGIDCRTVNSRFKYGWTFTEVFLTPVLERGPRK